MAQPLLILSPKATLLLGIDSKSVVLCRISVHLLDCDGPVSSGHCSFSHYSFFFQSTCSASQRLGVVQGGRPVRIPDPPHPPDPPKVFKAVFLQFEIFGVRVGAKGGGEEYREEVFFFSTPCVYTRNTQNFVEN